MTKAKKMTGKVETTKLYTAEQAARILKISARRVRKLCSEGRLGRRFGGRAYMITAEELEEFKKIPREVGNPMFKKDNPRKRRR